MIHNITREDYIKDPDNYLTICFGNIRYRKKYFWQVKRAVCCLYVQTYKSDMRQDYIGALDSISIDLPIDVTNGYYKHEFRQSVDIEIINVSVEYKEVWISIESKEKNWSIELKEGEQKHISMFDILGVGNDEGLMNVLAGHTVN